MNKLFGFFFCMLLITTAFLPVSGLKTSEKKISQNDDSSAIESFFSRLFQPPTTGDDYDWWIYQENVYTGIENAIVPPGNVGIGTTAPEYKLHIKTASPAIMFEEEDNDNKKWAIAGYDSGFVISEVGVDNHLYLEQGGNVGIGTKNPVCALEVYTTNQLAARFSGTVSGADATENDEFVTKRQLDEVSVQINQKIGSANFTPTSTDDPIGEIGDTSWDSEYFYVKTNAGWKRSSLETWGSSKQSAIN